MMGPGYLAYIILEEIVCRWMFLQELEDDVVLIGTSPVNGTGDCTVKVGDVDVAVEFHKVPRNRLRASRSSKDSFTSSRQVSIWAVDPSLEILMEKAMEVGSAFNSSVQDEVDPPVEKASPPSSSVNPLDAILALMEAEKQNRIASEAKFEARLDQLSSMVGKTPVHSESSIRAPALIPSPTADSVEVLLQKAASLAGPPPMEQRSSPSPSPIMHPQKSLMSANAVPFTPQSISVDPMFALLQSQNAILERMVSQQSASPADPLSELLKSKDTISEEIKLPGTKGRAALELLRKVRVDRPAERWLEFEKRLLTAIGAIHAEEDIGLPSGHQVRPPYRASQYFENHACMGNQRTLIRMSLCLCTLWEQVKGTPGEGLSARQTDLVRSSIAVMLEMIDQVATEGGQPSSWDLCWTWMFASEPNFGLYSSRSSRSSGGSSPLADPRLITASLTHISENHALISRRQTQNKFEEDRRQKEKDVAKAKAKVPP